HPPQTATLPLHDALPIYGGDASPEPADRGTDRRATNQRRRIIGKSPCARNMEALDKIAGLPPLAPIAKHASRFERADCQHACEKDRKSTRLNSSHDQISY